MNTPPPIYDSIGKSYNTTRRADPYLADTIYQLLTPRTGGHYLDVGCGTGNYLAALEARGLRMTGADPSETMLQAARARGLSGEFVLAAAEKLPFPDDSFDGAIAILTVHHWTDLPTGLRQIQRVVKKGGTFVLFTFTPKQVLGYWLAHYFPNMIHQGVEGIPDEDKIRSLLEEAGFTDFRPIPYFVQEDLQDQMMYAFKHRPERYLEEQVRRNTSGFALAKDQAEIATGLIGLGNDVASGKIAAIMAAYNNDEGDYLFVQVTKG